jgi:pyruvate dehydrogenase E1 component alpha subunit/2-oxoisovalerate dehydrogenase E1 component alpha subunit
VDPALKSSLAGRDCLKVAETQLLERKWADAQELAEWRQEAAQQIEEAVAKVRREPGPDPYREDWCALASKHLCEGHDGGE